MRNKTPGIAVMIFSAVVVTAAAPVLANENDGGAHAYTNRLSKEKSPYLLQHAHNPVDWYPWGKEAFEKAKKDNKPILLSIGYSTCHWCHVMERESFSNPEIAKLINDNFVPIKVDREERPDVDAMYMGFVVGTTGSGGWPMTVFLTPELKPFLGGTYYPPDAKYGMPGLKQLLPKINEAWQKDHEKVLASANQLSEALQKMAAAAPDKGAELEKGMLDKGYQQLAGSFDKRHGGFGPAPKFPQPVNLNFLLHYYHRSGERPALDMALLTLREMANGGMHDQLGGGFHRYSTDDRWFLPHFEKMLYDQAQLANVYLDAYQITHDESYANVARDVLNYVLRDMTGKDGQFYCAEDADSAVNPKKPEEKAEGAFYVWSIGEIRRTLDDNAANMFIFHYGLEPNGNVDRDPHNEFAGKNVLYVAHGVAETTRNFDLPERDVENILADARGRLLKVRGLRPRPQLDDKTIVAWNGLMISALARAGAILQEPRYTHAAVKAADFVRNDLYDAEGHTLTRVWRDGRGGIGGFLSDYAFFVSGLLDLYETTLDIRWLKLAADLEEKQEALFWDRQSGGYFDTTGTDPSVLPRTKEDSDDAEPSANSIAALNLLRLSQMIDSSSLSSKAQKTLKAFAGRLSRFPAAMPQMLVAYDFHLDKPRQIVLAGKPDGPDTRTMLREVFARYLPNKIVLLADGGEGQKFLGERVAFLKSVAAIDGRATAYVCESYACQLPTNEPSKLAALLDAAGAGAARVTQPPGAAPPDKGERAREFSLATLDGEFVSLSKLMMDGPVVLVVLRGWPGYQCPICTRQVADLVGHAKEIEKTGARVVLVYPGPGEKLKEHAEEFRRGKGIPASFYFVIDPDYKFTNQYGLRWGAPNETAYPSTFVIDRDATIRFARVSKTHGGRATAATILKELDQLK